MGTERKHDGGPAFPCTNEQFMCGNPKTGDAWPGLTLRDYFAGQAISSEQVSRAYHCTPDALAKYAYEIADALLAERSR